MIESLRTLLRPLATRIANMVARAVVQRVDDSTRLQLLQLGTGPGEIRDGCERFQEYGFSSVPLPGAEAVVVFPNGRRDHGLVVAVGDRRYRLAGLAAGEVALYTDEGDSIILRRGRTVVVTSPHVELGGGTMEPATLATSLRTELDAIWLALQTHVHPGVATGGGSTGEPVVVKAAQTIASAAVKVRT